MEEILGNTMNTDRNSNQTNQFFIKFNIIFRRIQIPFYRNERRAVVGEKLIRNG